jgi:hypothetical protein
MHGDAHMGMKQKEKLASAERPASDYGANLPAAAPQEGDSAAPQESDADLAYTIDGLSKKSKVGKRKIYYEIKSGRLIARKVGRRTIITAPEARTWLFSLPVAA